jgi:hypothetical protein
MSTPFAIQQLAKKLRLEAHVIPKLTRFFRGISRTIQPVLKVTGQVPPMAPFRDDLIEILTKHYDRTSKAFQGDTVSTLTKSMEFKQDTIEGAVEETSDKVDEALLALIALRAPKQADLILETTNKELNEARSRAIIEAAKDGETLTLAQQGRKTEQDFNSKIPGRVDTIAMYETQSMAEDTKLIEAEAIMGEGVVIGGVSVAIAMRKTWNTVLDENTRESHVLADLQETSVVRPFIVQGQRLKVPGDTSLGASLSNVINCRCAASYGLGN